MLKFGCILYKSNEEKVFDTSYLMMMDDIDQDHKNDDDGDDAQSCGPHCDLGNIY